MSRIGIFGGTFNPPHKAHRYLAKEMKRCAELDKIIIIPTFVPPHKQTTQLQSGSDRLEMCKRNFFESYFEISDIEIIRQGKSYTVDTLETLRKKYPNDELFLIIGSDMLLSFHQWYRYQDILSLATLCVASREDDVNLGMLVEYAETTLGKSREKGEIIISKIPPVELSSTLIRKKIADGADVSDLLCAEVFNYIKEKGLYT